MEKYLIAIGFVNNDVCIDEAESLQKTLKEKGIRSYYKNNISGCVTLTTPNGVIEFITGTLTNDENFTVGKRYDRVFYIVPNRCAFMGRVKDNYYYTDYLTWILDQENERKTAFSKNMKCYSCKNFPICSIKNDYGATQYAINSIVEASDHFKEATLDCEYYISKSPIFPCGCI